MDGGKSLKVWRDSVGKKVAVENPFVSPIGSPSGAERSLFRDKIMR